MCLPPSTPPGTRLLARATQLLNRTLEVKDQYFAILLITITASKRSQTLNEFVDCEVEVSKNNALRWVEKVLRMLIKLDESLKQASSLISIYRHGNNQKRNDEN